jgi:CMP-N,N'-diacetyllegionaminic acid synthase
MEVSAIVLARGGSKGIPQKNIMDFCGKPLLAWTIEHCLASGVDSVYVSSDAEGILDVGEKYGAHSIIRPKEISGDEATSESGWLHALEVIERDHGKLDWVLTPQVTSPLRTADDIQKGLTIARSGQYDSLFSCSIAEDLFFWEDRTGNLESVNYDWQNRKRRQDIKRQYIENGSFYLFRPEILRQNNNRFGGKVGVVEMEFWKMFEIDSKEDFRMCSALMKEFIINEKKA